MKKIVGFLAMILSIAFVFCGCESADAEEALSPVISGEICGAGTQCKEAARHTYFSTSDDVIYLCEEHFKNLIENNEENGIECYVDVTCDNCNELAVFKYDDYFLCPQHQVELMKQDFNVEMWVLMGESGCQICHQDIDKYFVGTSGNVEYYCTEHYEKNNDKASTSSSETKYINGENCGICGDKATQEINDEYYCDEHFKDAVAYYLDLD